MSDAPTGPRRLHPISLVGTSLKSLPGVLIGAVGAFSALVQRNPVLAIGIALVLLAIAILGAVIGWWLFTYEVREGEIVIERGLLSRQRRVIPFDRVRDVSIEQPLLGRIVGTAKVRIETGGAKADEGVLDMITLGEAHALRDHIRRSNILETPAAAPRGTSETQPAGAPEEPVIFAMSIGRVLGSGLFNFSLIFVALALGALQYLSELRVIDLEQIADDGGARSLLDAFTWRTGLVLAVLLVLLGVVSGIVTTLLRDFGFRLTVGPTGLRRRRGLITLSEVLIPARRTEAARVDTGLISGAFGWHAVAFQTLGAEAKEGGVQVAAPFARAEEIALILAQAGFPARPEAAMIRPPARALLRRSLPWLLVAAALIAASQVWPVLRWGLPLPFLLALIGLLSWLRDGHRFGEHALFVRMGLITRRVWIIPYEKLQTMTTRRTPLQRLLGLATIAPDTAGASPLGAPRIADIISREAPPLAGQLLARFYEARARVRAALIPSGRANGVEPRRGGA